MSELPPGGSRKGTAEREIGLLVMDCEEFLQGYSDYSDRLRTPEQLRDFESHMRQCQTCARYDRVVRQGIDLFRQLPRPDTSPDFLPRLRHRLYHIDDHTVLGSRLGGGVALVAMAAVGLLAIVWLPFASRIPVEVELAPVAVTAPTPPSADLPSLFSPGPFVTPVIYDGAGGGTVVPSVWWGLSDSHGLFEPTLVQAGSAARDSDRSR